MISGAIEEGRLETVLDEYTSVTTGLYAVYPYSKLVSTKMRAFVDFVAASWGLLISVERGFFGRWLLLSPPVVHEHFAIAVAVGESNLKHQDKELRQRA